MTRAPERDALPERNTALQLSSMVPPTHFGGAERVIDWLTRELQRAGLHVRTAGLRQRGGAPDGTEAHRIDNIYWPFDGQSRGVLSRTSWHAIATFMLTARRAVESLLDEIRPAVVITHNLRGWGYAPWVAVGARGIPLIQVVHDYGLICNPATLWRGAPCETLCRSCVLRRGVAGRRWPGGQFVAVSQALLDTYRVHGGNMVDGALVVHPTSAAKPSEPSAPLLPRNNRNGLPDTIGFLGRLTEAKGLETLLSAMQTTSQRLLVAGDGEKAYVRSLHRSASSNVDWLGWVDPGRLFEQIDVLVVPSVWHEPFGLVVVEAARAQVPVLLADRPGLVEAARASAARYLTFSASDPSSLAEALRRPMVDYVAQDVVVHSADLVQLVLKTVSNGANAQRPR